MVIRPNQRRQTGALATECVAALAIFTLAAVPLSYAFLLEARYSRSCHHRAAAMEIVDGEIEILAAGEWRSFARGTRDYPVTASAATNLPPGRFVLTLDTARVRLEWRPSAGGTNAVVVRERPLP